MRWRFALARKNKKLKIWLVIDSEPLPVMDGYKKMRMGELADKLLAQGHEVTWFASTFFHITKSKVYDDDQDIMVKDRLRMILLESGSYKKNIDLARWRHHKKFAQNLAAKMRELDAPDVIVTAFPIVGMAYEVVRFGREKDVPVIVDIRDMWPDIFVDHIPFMKYVKWIALRSMDKMAKYCFRGARSLVAVSQTFLDWGVNKVGDAPESRAVFPLGARNLTQQNDPDTEKVAILRQAVEGKTVFTYLGSFGRVYNLDVVCQVARRFHDQGRDDVHFILAGHGVQFDELVAQCDGLPNVSFPGWLLGNEVGPVMGMSDVAILPNKADLIPNKLFDYVASGLPVVASLQGEGAEFLTREQLGVLYQHDQPDTLEAALLDLMDADKQSVCSANAARVFADQFDSEGIYQRFAAHVCDIARKA